MWTPLRLCEPVAWEFQKDSERLREIQRDQRSPWVLEMKGLPTFQLTLPHQGWPKCSLLISASENPDDQKWNHGVLSASPPQLLCGCGDKSKYVSLLKSHILGFLLLHSALNQQHQCCVVMWIFSLPLYFCHGIALCMPWKVPCWPLWLLYW